ncbi:MAG TPA: 3-oxoacyl-ACP reductase family protein [Chloroflexota bacterium]|jgi:3-oxoacyl-[acyl-carrier protein] reductase
MSLDERVAIVTGGGKGIGKHYCQGLAHQGAAVVVAEIDPAAAETTAAELRAHGYRAMEAPTDVSDEASVRAMVERTRAEFGRIDVLVNNAAIFASVGFTHAPHDQIGVDEWDRMFAVNVRGVWLCCRAVIPQMREQGYGKIVNIASGTAWKGTPYMLHYVTSKAAVAGLTRALAREVGTDGIRVNTIAPGYTESESLAPSVTPERRARALSERIIQRPEYPDDLVGAVLFLASPASDFMTGQTLHVDGGSVLT